MNLQFHTAKLFGWVSVAKAIDMLIAVHVMKVSDIMGLMGCST